MDALPESNERRIMIIEKERFLFVLLLILVVGYSIADELPVTEECSGNHPFIYY